MQTGIRTLLLLHHDREDVFYGIALGWRTGNRGKVRRGLFDLIICPSTVVAAMDMALPSDDTQVPKGITFELSRDAWFCDCDHTCHARVPRHNAPFCLDHSRTIPVIVPVMLLDEGNSEVINFYIVTSDRICALAEKFGGLSVWIPWEEWEDSLTFVGNH